MRIYFVALLRSSLIIDLTTDSFRVLHAVDSFNVKHKLVSCRQFQTIFLCLPVEDRVFSFCMN